MESYRAVRMQVFTYCSTSLEVACRDAYPNLANLFASSLWLLNAATYLAGLSLSSHIPENNVNVLSFIEFERTIITFLDSIYRHVSYLKHNVSEPDSVSVFR